MRILYLALLCGAVHIAHAQRMEVKGITYEVVSGGVAVVRGAKPYTGYIAIPSSIVLEGRSYSVKEISSRAFSQSYVSSISIPSSVQTIGAEAFKGCRSLMQINLPSSLKSLGVSCFEDCTNLKSVDLGYGSVRELPSRCFKDCRMLYSVRLSSDVHTIGDYCFQNCNALSDIRLSSRLEYIGREAFRDCRRLRGLTLPATLHRLGSHCFAGCQDMRALYCESRVPFSVYDSSVFNAYGTNLLKICTLYVPRGTLSAYQRTAGWRDFQKIQER
ncbi:MAG: leucine-rich repeat domain-containing protein [Bacteroidaceae bacterium]|nr:leucine-rich repeat domain-containing protein [Bacteroidaceae bacterium]